MNTSPARLFSKPALGRQLDRDTRTISDAVACLKIAPVAVTSDGVAYFDPSAIETLRAAFAPAAPLRPLDSALQSVHSAPSAFC